MSTKHPNDAPNHEMCFPTITESEHTISSVPVVLLCGGHGTRIKEVTQDAIPKALLPFGSTTLIDHSLHLLKENAIERVILGVSHHGQQIREHIRKNWSGAFDFSFSETPSPLGICASLLLACEQCGVHSDCLLMGADEICDGLRFAEAFTFHKAVQAEITLILIDNVEPEYRSLTAGIDDQGRLFCLERSDLPAPLYSTGLAFVSPTFRACCKHIEHDPSGRLLLQQLLPQMMSHGAAFGHVSTMRRYLHVGSPEAYRKALQSAPTLPVSAQQGDPRPSGLVNASP